jgi:uncharacterized protein
MLKRSLATLIMVIFISSAKSNPCSDSLQYEEAITLHTASGEIYGTLAIPHKDKRTAIALIIAGSGPTDRNGNNPMMKNECLRLLSKGLYDNGIASLRYDKRGIAASVKAGKPEVEMRFEDYVTDARDWIELLRKDTRFSKVYIIGHSEGSLIGMIAAYDIADGFISVAGAGNSADKLLKGQLATQPENIKQRANIILDSLAMFMRVKDVPLNLYFLFRPSVQPYMLSWIKYDPAHEIGKLKMPILIVQGTHDIQVTEPEAVLLAASNKNSKLVVIKDMNHVLKIVPEVDRKANLLTYAKPSLPISTELINNITTFIINHSSDKR